MPARSATTQAANGAAAQAAVSVAPAQTATVPATTPALNAIAHAAADRSGIAAPAAQTRRLADTPRPMRRVRTSVRATPRSHANDPVWLLDLDNTLHDTSHAIFSRIDRAMGQAVQDLLGVDKPTSHRLRKAYWQRYGATMIGLVRHHGVDAREFLLRSHDFDVLPLIKAESALADKLRRLRGRKILLTNAPLDYAMAVLSHLRCLHLIDSLWGIEEMRLFGQYRPKPSRAMLRHVLACERVAPHRAVLVEDTLDNLKAARAVGLRTAYVYHHGTPFSRQLRNRASCVDLRVLRFGELVSRQTLFR